MIPRGYICFRGLAMMTPTGYICVKPHYLVLFRHHKYLTASVVSSLVCWPEEHWFKPSSGQPKDYEIVICSFFAKHSAIRSKSKDWLARNQVNVSRVEQHVCLPVDCFFRQLCSTQWVHIIVSYCSLYPYCF